MNFTISITECPLGCNRCSKQIMFYTVCKGATSRFPYRPKSLFRQRVNKFERLEKFLSNQCALPWKPDALEIHLKRIGVTRRRPARVSWSGASLLPSAAGLSLRGRASKSYWHNCAISWKVAEAKGRLLLQSQLSVLPDVHMMDMIMVA